MILLVVLTLQTVILPSEGCLSPESPAFSFLSTHTLEYTKQDMCYKALLERTHRNLRRSRRLEAEERAQVSTTSRRRENYSFIDVKIKDQM